MSCCVFGCVVLRESACPQTHTHTHTHTRVCVYTCPHPHTRACMCKHCALRSRGRRHHVQASCASPRKPHRLATKHTRRAGNLRARVGRICTILVILQVVDADGSRPRRRAGGSSCGTAGARRLPAGKHIPACVACVQDVFSGDTRRRDVSAGCGGGRKPLRACPAPHPLCAVKCRIERAGNLHAPGARTRARAAAKFDRRPWRPNGTPLSRTPRNFATGSGAGRKRPSEQSYRCARRPPAPQAAGLARSWARIRVAPAVCAMRCAGSCTAPLLLSAAAAGGQSLCLRTHCGNSFVRSWR